MPILDNLLVSLGFKVNTDPLHHVNEALEGVNHKLEILAGIEIAKGLYELVEHFSHFGDDLEMAAYQAGITAENFQKLVYAGAQFNVTQEQLQGGLAKMSRLLAGARDGSKKAVETFTHLGISQDQVAGFQNAEDAFYAVQDALAGIPDSFARVNETTKIFGRGAVSLTKFAAVGSRATKQLGREAVAMGAIVSNEGVAGLAEFEDSMKAFGITTKAFFGNMAASLAPAFKEMIRSVQALIGTNSKLISQNFDVWSERIAFALGFMVEMFRVVTGSISKFIQEHPKLIAFGLKTAAIFVSMSIAGGLLKMAFAPLRLVFTVISAAVGLLGGTVTAALVGVLALVLGLKALWDMAHGKSFSDTALGKGLGWLKDYAVEATKALQELSGVKEKADINLAYASEDQLVSPLSNEAIAGKASFWDQALAGISGANNGMDVLQSSAVRRTGGYAPNIVPQLLARPEPQSITVSAPITLNVNGPADVANLEKHLDKAATKVFERVARRTAQDTAPAAHR